MTRALAILMGLLLPVAASAATAPPESRGFRYVDPKQLDLPFPYYSLIRQPWRSYLETTPASTYLSGLGVVWGGSVPGKSDAQIVAELAWGGFRRVRVEFPWSALRWDEAGAQPEFAAHLTSLLAALKASGLRPLILLNANHGAPCPMQTSDWHLARGAHIGDRQIQVSGSFAGVAPMFSLVTTLGGGGHAGPLVTEVESGGLLTLSRPVQQDLPAGATVQIARLKYQPLFPVGTPEFEHTAQGWLAYVAYVLHFVGEAYGTDFDLEMWNELSFGSDFLDVNHYFAPPHDTESVDFLHSGGPAWELAGRTAAEVGRLDPAARLIWGFSNTTFFHTAVADLPPGFSGQSYHPYGVVPRCYARLIVGRERYNADGFVPSGCASMPEGWAQTFQQTETLMRLLNPTARSAHPPGVEHFEHYITEHGFSPAELEIHDANEMAHAKEKFLLRATLFWLNKGLSGLYIYDSYDAAEKGFGVLRQDGGVSPALEALHRLVARLEQAASAPVAVTALDASVEQLTGHRGVYSNDPQGQYVAEQQQVAVLPFSLGAGRLAIAVYIMTEDFPKDLEPQRFRITLRGIDARRAAVGCYDPLTDGVAALTVHARSTHELIVDVELTDSPRLLEIAT